VARVTELARDWVMWLGQRVEVTELARGWVINVAGGNADRGYVGRDGE